jgi:hypothetical protein
MKNSKVTKAVVTVAAGVTVAVMVGRIIPVNLHSGSAATKFSTVISQQECCGPYAAPCPDFVCVAPN